MFGISGGSFGGSGVKKYAVVADLPLTGVKPGTLAHVEENLQGESALYLWSGTQLSGGWYRVATVNLAPNISQGPEAAYALPTDGSPITLALAAEDPEGLPISWSYQVSEGALEGVAQVVQDGGTFMIAADPAAVSNKTPGAFSITFVASDGVSLSAATSSFTLSFRLGLLDPSNFAEVGSVDLTAYPSLRSFAHAGGFVFATGTTDGLVVIDLRDTSAPVVYPPVNLGFSNGNPGGWEVAVSSDGQVIAIGSTAADETRLVDVSNPASPVLGSLHAWSGSGYVFQAPVGRYFVVFSLTQYRVLDGTDPAAGVLGAIGAGELGINAGHANIGAKLYSKGYQSASNIIELDFSVDSMLPSKTVHPRGADYLPTSAAAFPEAGKVILSNGTGNQLFIYDVSGGAPVLQETYTGPASARTNIVQEIDGLAYVGGFDAITLDVSGPAVAELGRVTSSFGILASVAVASDNSVFFYGPQQDVLVEFK